ncbi:uncharacterized protein LOC127095745 [Lathyrus oleraceus]|uniref:uncharacterized protein LOC127095745 n=1 Tax=Pisum sativum TaxID=3888 RepID=UPI0021CFD0A9|nr:uncharacterized protein LOC127095745 [Pisum sativum]
MGVWDVIVNGPNQTKMTNGEGVIVLKLKNKWNDNDKKLWSHDWKAQDILIYVLGVDEYYRVFHCEIAKVMWDALEVSNEGTNKVIQANINTLNQQFELFRMKHSETIANLQKKFIHLINRLNALGNCIFNAIATNKVLICLNRD